MLKEGIYEEIINSKLKKQLEELSIDYYEIGKENIDVEEARKVLSSYISEVTRRALRYARENASDDKEALLSQIRTCNDVISILSDRLDGDEFDKLKISEEGEILTSVYAKINSLKSIKKESVIRPITPISQSSLFTGSNYEPNMLGELQKEILSCDAIDMLVSFIKWSGLRCIYEELKRFTEQKNSKLRVITTSYMEATDLKAVLELSKLKNTEVKISYDVDRTRLHAKAYMFKRETGFSTCYIGSSNLSNPALTSGLEWNIKVTEKDSFDIIKKFETTFESYWNDGEFIPFNVDNEQDILKLKSALNKEKQKDIDGFTFNFDIQPYHYQKEILERLQVERKVYGRNKNLLVAATGVGKTVISAFDYKQYKRENSGRANLLFVAHREEILKQSRDTFRAILKDNNFGGLLVGRYSPSALENLFISIQSFNSHKLHENTTEDFYDFIIVDEFHHAAADSYQQLLDYYKPKILLGLTATPERMDGKNILGYFDNTIASEMRLTEAIDRKLLSPFQYFGVSDTVDLSKLKWSRKGYDTRELEKVYTLSDKRTHDVVVKNIYQYVSDINEVKGLGFCVSIEHAKYMANFFNKVNIPSIALHGGTDRITREEAKDKLVNGDIRFIFAVDLYNEGVDIPEINTVLFLRPTESLTIFLQQLGRGLRLADGKECLTVLDFVGQAHKNYNFEEKFRALTGKTKHSVRHYVENGFYNLPRGCFIQLEKQAKEYILRNIKESSNTKKNLIEKIKYFKEDTGLDLTLSNFLKHHHLSLYELYGRYGDRTFDSMKVEAGLKDSCTPLDSSTFAKRLTSLFHLNSRKLLDFLIGYINNPVMNDQEEKLMLNMLYYSFYSASPEKQDFASIEAGVNDILKDKDIKEEILEILQYNYDNLSLLEIEHEFNFPCPLGIHSSYSTAQVLAAFGYYNEENSPSFREGVKYFKDKNLDIFFVTLNKSEKDFSPSTLYEDYAINERLFHWQTQSKVSQESKTAQRYINHRNTGNKIAMFLREYKTEDGVTSPFVFLGTCDYVSHSGNKPMSIIWRLKHEMPPNLVPKANKSIL